MRTRHLIETLHAVMDLFAPYTCLACDAPYADAPDGVACFCAVCAEGLVPLGLERPAGVFAPYAHGGPLARAIHRVKYECDPAGAHRLGELFLAGCEDVMRGVDVVVPVPLYSARHAARGFNQAEEMARALGVRVAPRAVERVRDTPAQVGRGRRARIVNVQGAFALRDPEAVRGQRVLVLDDVSTTGATLTACADALRAGEPARVMRAALACEE